MTTAPNVHIYFVLDRSGSMKSMATDVVGGFNAFLAEQKANGADASMTLIQFDSHDDHEVLADGLPLADIEPLTAARFVPRSGSPLYDAIGDATIRAEPSRAEQRRADGSSAEEILFVANGEENRSSEYTRESLFELVTKREEAGCTFVYLGANQDSYAAGGGVGHRAGTTQNFAGDGRGSRAGFDSLSSSVSERRDKIRRQKAYDKADLFEGDKGAEEDLGRRGS